MRNGQPGTFIDYILQILWGRGEYYKPKAKMACCWTIMGYVLAQYWQTLGQCAMPMKIL